MKINNRELEVMAILGEAGRPLISTEIVKTGKGLTQSTVQAVLRKLMNNDMVEVQGVTHSGNVLSRQFALTQKGKSELLNDFIRHYNQIRSIVSKQEILDAIIKEN